MHLVRSVLGLIATLTACELFACSPPPPDSWSPLTVRAAFDNADVVVLAKVIDQSKIESDAEKVPDQFRRLMTGMRARIDVIRVFKGEFKRDTVYKGQCEGGFRIGEEVVFFLLRSSHHVSTRDQPSNVTTAQVLEELSKY